MEKGLTNINILYFSFEVSAEILFAKLLSLYIYDTFGKVVSYEQILSFNDIIDDETYILLKKAKEWLLRIENMITVIDTARSSDGVYAALKDWCIKFGTEQTITSKTGKKHIVFTPDDPDLLLLVVLDHVKLLLAKKRSIREEIELCCSYLITIRNIYKCNITIVQQLNRNSKSMDRKLNGYELLGLDDLSDSSAPGQAAETVLGLFNAYRENVPKCQGYVVKGSKESAGLKDRFRLVQVMKNRYGRSDVYVGAAFYGEIGYWKELPPPNEMGSDISKWTTLSNNDEKQIIKDNTSKNEMPNLTFNVTC